MQQIIRLTSVTYAIRAQKVLEQHGIRSHVRKLVKNLQVSGCGYGLEVVGDIHLAARLISEAGIRIVEVVREDA